MLKQIFSLYEITESQITGGAISRLKWASVISFFVVPLFGVLYLFEPAANIKPLVLILSYLSMLGFFILGFSRSLNRLWIPDRYLDESEISRKREINHFAFVWLISGVMLILVTLIFLNSFGAKSPVFMTNPQIMFFSLALVCMTGMSLQGLKLSRVLTPISDEERTGQNRRKDKTYLVCVFVYITSVLLITYLLK